MIRRLGSLGGEAHLLYCARNRQEAPFHSELEAMSSEKISIQCHFSDEVGSMASIKDYLSAYSSEDHFYCCGPTSMLNAFESACESLGLANVHVERFKAVARTEQPATDGQCVVELAKSGRTLTIPKGKALLECLLAADVDVQYSCAEGVCGACETRVISGEADHRDSVLSKAQKASNKVMMLCVSRCKSDRLVLDL
jgi:tetrachlorobenzoquinone reductase